MHHALSTIPLKKREVYVEVTVKDCQEPTQRTTYVLTTSLKWDQKFEFITDNDHEIAIRVRLLPRRLCFLRKALGMWKGKVDLTSETSMKGEAVTIHEWRRRSRILTRTLVQ